MQSIDALFSDYSAYHQTAGNKLFHRFGIPMIMLGLIGMLARVHLGPVVDAAMILIALSEIYYLAVEWRLGLGMLLISVGFYFLGLAIPMWANVALFVVGWIFQFIGHKVYEHKNPAFFRNFVHLLVGPLWILNGFMRVRSGNLT